MARGGSETFGDTLYKVLTEIARGKLSPDADIDFLSDIEQMILNRYKSSQPSGATEATGGMDMMGGGMGGEAPIPVAPIEPPLSRGPTPSPDLSGATEELSRIMSGA